VTTPTMKVAYSAPTAAFQLPPELQELKVHVRQLVEEQCIPLEPVFLGAERAAATGTAGSAGAPTWGAEQVNALKKLSQEAGVYDVHLPVEYGGAGYGVLGRFVVEEEINRSIVKLPAVRVPGILYGCTPEQEERYLLPTVRGEKTYAFAQTEPGAGSDPGNSMATSAVPDGADWVLNGTKTFITFAATCDYFLVLAVTDPVKRQRGGITMFIVDADSPGISRSPVPLWLPGATKQYEVHFEDVRVPATQVLGDVGEGFRLGQQWLAIQDRLTRGSLACGILSRCLELATSWAQERVTFGAPLADRQAIQWMLVDVFADLKAIRAVSYECAALADAGQDVRVNASLSKLLGANWGHRSIDRIMQVFGGLGESLEMPISHWYRELRHGRIGGGTDEMQRMVIARALFREGRTLWAA
jgi:acyl-CoA dehydrogenase